MNIRPYKQGELDRLCSLYALINAVRSTGFKLTRLQTQAVADDIIENLSSGDLKELMLNGAEQPNLSKVMRAFIVYGFYRVQVPHYNEIYLLERLRNYFRKIAPNLNLPVYAHNSELSSGEESAIETQRKLQCATYEMHTCHVKPKSRQR